MVLALVLSRSLGTNAFAPYGTNMPSSFAKVSRSFSNAALVPSSSFVGMKTRPMKGQRSLTSLRMAADDFDQSKYTESAWSAIASLTKAADYYEASTVDPPLLMDILLNPSKHGAGDDGESAKKVVEKALQRAGVNVKDLRSELEKYLAKQPKVSGSSQVVMGRNFQKLLDSARTNKSMLGVRCLHRTLQHL